MKMHLQNIFYISNFFKLFVQIARKALISRVNFLCAPKDIILVNPTNSGKRTKIYETGSRRHFVEQLVGTENKPRTRTNQLLTRSGLQMLCTMEAPVRRETTTTTDDQPRDGVPTADFPPPNFLATPLIFFSLLSVLLKFPDSWFSYSLYSLFIKGPLGLLSWPVVKPNIISLISRL